MRVVVAGGGTIAPIDAVRHIANAATGRLAAAIGEAALEGGDETWHVLAPGAARPFWRAASCDLDASDPDAEWVRLDKLRRRWLACRSRAHLVPLNEGTVADYARTLEGVLAEARPDLVFLAMAASDFEPERATGKIDSSVEELWIRCRATPKVIRSVRGWVPSAYLVGFKLFAGADRATQLRVAAEACTRNAVDLTVANDAEDIRAGRHALLLVRPGQPAEEIGSGANLGKRLFERVRPWACAKRGVGS